MMAISTIILFISSQDFPYENAGMLLKLKTNSSTCFGIGVKEGVDIGLNQHPVVLFMLLMTDAYDGQHVLEGIFSQSHGFCLCDRVHIPQTLGYL